MALPIGIADHKRGDTWDGIEITAKTLNESNAEVAMNLTGASVVAEFKYLNGNLAFSFDTADNSILVPEPLTGILYFDSKIIDAVEGVYSFDVEVTFPDGTVTTIVPTHTWKIYS